MRQLTSKDWFGKASAGLIFGFLAALGLSGVFKLTAGVSDTFFSLPGQFSMWMMSPVWALVLSFCFLFPSSRSAWGWLALANGLLWGSLWLMGGLAA